MKRLISALVLAFMLCASAAFAADKEAVILAAFGTSEPAAKVALDDLGAAYTAKGHDIIWSFSSDIIRNKLHGQGEHVYAIDEALAKAASMGAKTVRVQSLHIVPAEEYVKTERRVAAYLAKNPAQFNKVYMGHSLLESTSDLAAVVKAVSAALPAERKSTDAVVFMGHGNDRGPGDLIISSAAHALHSADPMFWLASVEGSNTLDKVFADVKASKAKRVWLVPFMIVAGDHARNDLAGPEEDSWASQFKAAGFEVHSILNGLGSNKAIQSLFLEHTHNTRDELLSGKKN